jgi:hypothetical protein
VPHLERLALGGKGLRLRRAFRRPPEEARAACGFGQLLRWRCDALSQQLAKSTYKIEISG